MNCPHTFPPSLFFKISWRKGCVKENGKVVFKLPCHPLRLRPPPRTELLEGRTDSSALDTLLPQ